MWEEREEAVSVFTFHSAGRVDVPPELTHTPFVCVFVGRRAGRIELKFLMLGTSEARQALDAPLLPTTGGGPSAAAAGTVEGGHTGSTTAGKARVDLLDNAKAVLIACVVLYHAAVVYTSADRPEGVIPFWSGLLAILKMIVMPCFCLISGHLSPAAFDDRRARSLFALFITYMSFQILYYLNIMLSFRLNGFPFEPLPVKVFQPEGQAVTWFLLALLIWRISLPLFSTMRWPITASLLVGSVALFTDLGVNFQNIASFFPYFIIGHRLPRTLWQDIQNRHMMRRASAAFSLSVTAAMLVFSVYGGEAFAECFARLGLTYACFNGAPPAEHADECGSIRELASRLAFYVASAPLILGFLCMLPTKRGVWSVPGYMSMYVYLLHPLILFNPLMMHFAFEFLSQFYGREVNVWSPATDSSAPWFILPVAMLVCALLSTRGTRAVFWPIVEPPIDALFIMRS